MDPKETIAAYMKRTGQTIQEVMAGVQAFGYAKTLELVSQAEQKKKRLVFYYQTEADVQRDTPSYRFE